MKYEIALKIVKNDDHESAANRLVELYEVIEKLSNEIERLKKEKNDI